MSLVMSAAPFDNENTYTPEINKKHSSHNKTQKKISAHRSVDQAKVNSVLQSIHSASNDMHDENEMGDFSPPSPPVSSGVEKTRDVRESPTMNLMQEQGGGRGAVGSSADANENDDRRLDVNTYETNYASHAERDDYYKQYVPNYSASNNHQTATPSPSSINRPYYTNSSQQPTMGSLTGDQNVLLEKLNYMIHLLEEQQEEKGGSVAEEVILYSFLGIFVIFLVDSFTRIGKYKR